MVACFCLSFDGKGRKDKQKYARLFFSCLCFTLRNVIVAISGQFYIEKEHDEKEHDGRSRTRGGGERTSPFPILGFYLNF